MSAIARGLWSRIGKLPGIHNTDPDTSLRVPLACKIVDAPALLRGAEAEVEGIVGGSGVGVPILPAAVDGLERVSRLAHGSRGITREWGRGYLNDTGGCFEDDVFQSGEMVI